MKRRRGTLLCGCLAAAGLLVAAPVCASDYVELSSAADYSVGDYGDVEKTKLLFVTGTAKLRTGAWTLRAMLPYLYVKGPANVVPSDRDILAGLQPAAITSRHGIGDLAITAERSFRASDRLFIDIIGRIKIPTASVSKGLGTGTTSFTASAEISRLAGPYILSVRAGRRFNGSSERFRQRDVWEAAASLFRVGDRTSFGLSYEWRGKVRRTSFERSEVTAFAARKLSRQLELQAYAIIGLSNGSPDQGAGVVLVYRFR